MFVFPECWWTDSRSEDTESRDKTPTGNGSPDGMPEFGVNCEYILSMTGVKGPFFPTLAGEKECGNLT